MSSRPDNDPGPPITALTIVVHDDGCAQGVLTVRPTNVDGMIDVCLDREGEPPTRIVGLAGAVYQAMLKLVALAACAVAIA